MSMSVARISEIVSELTKTTAESLDGAIKQGIAGGNEPLRDLRVWWIKEERIAKGAATEYQVNMMIGFVIDD